MLNIIKGGFTSGAHERIKREILKRTEQGKKTLLIVPEQQTLLAESEMADILPPSAALVFEVTNFTRLANTTARALGGISGEYCDNTKKALLMWRTLTELSPILSGVSGGINEGLVNRYLEASQNLDSLGISADMLSASAESEFVRDGRLKHKIQDLTAVHSLYKKLLGERYGDSQNECAAMLAKLRENPEYLKDAAIYIEGFISFTETQYAILGALASRSNLTVILYISHASGESFEYTEVRGTLDRLKGEAKLADTGVKIISENSRNDGDIISLAVDLIWRTKQGFDNLSLQNPEKIRIFEAETPFDECEFVASDIRRRVMAGASFSDFAIVARDAEKYRGVLDASLSLSGVPAFISNYADVLSSEAVKHIFAAYAVLRSGYSRECVISYAKCALCGISREECDLFEQYAEKWQITGSRFTESDDWAMNPAGYSKRRTKQDLLNLERINSAKQRLITPLADFGAAIKKAKTVSEQARALYDHLLNVDFPKKLSARAKELAAVSEHAHAEVISRLWQIICQALDVIVAVSGELPSDGESFSGQLRVALGNISLSKIPAYVDEVTVGSADMLRLYGKKHIYLIGVNAGEFPGVATDNAYFSEADKSALSKAGLTLAPDLEKRGARELYLFARAFSWAEESVTLSYSARDNKFKAKECSDVIPKITRLFGEKLQTVKISSLSAEEKLYSAKSALVNLASFDKAEIKAAEDALSRAGYSEPVRLSGESITNGNLSLSPVLASGMQRAEIPLSQTKIDSFLNCPFGYFCKYTLRLCAEERAEFDARNIGTFIHSILENVFKELAQEGRETDTLTEKEREKLVTDAAKGYLDELGEGSLTSERTKIKINRLVRAAMPVVDGLCEEFAVSKFKPRFFELSIKRDEDGAVEPVVSKSPCGRDIYIHGYIDRVDTYEKDGNVYVRVVDYKTGKKLFSPDDPKNGTNLQMFLYLKALLDEDRAEFKSKLGVGEGGRVIPAGVIYVNTSINDVKVDRPDDKLAEAAVKAAQLREGMVLDDGEIISAMGLKYTPLYNAKTPTKIPESKKTLLFTEESLDGILEDCMRASGETADAIAEGNIKAIPKIHGNGDTFCDNCDFKSICRKAVIT